MQLHLCICKFTIYIIFSSDFKECFWNWVTIKWVTSIATYGCRGGWRGYSYVRLRDWSNRQVSNVVVMSCTPSVSFYVCGFLSTQW